MYQIIDWKERIYLLGKIYTAPVIKEKKTSSLSLSYYENSYILTPLKLIISDKNCKDLMILKWPILSGEKVRTYKDYIEKINNLNDWMW